MNVEQRYHFPTMDMSKFLVLALFSLLIAVAVSGSSEDGNRSGLKSILSGTLTETAEEVADFTDSDNDDVDHIDPDTFLDGIRLADLSSQELSILLDDADNVIIAELDILCLKRKLEDREITERNTEGNVRPKRWGLVARMAARALFRGASRGRLSSSGSRLTQQYTRPGDYNTALRDFNRFNPSGQSSFSGRVSGRTGTVGNHRFTVRDGSSSGRPTLEIRSPRRDGSTFVRKFRYGDN